MRVRCPDGMSLICQAARALEILLILGGVACMASFVSLEVERRYFASQYLQEFERLSDDSRKPEALRPPAGPSRHAANGPAIPQPMDVAGQRKSSTSLTDTHVLARLRISSIGLDVPVLEGVEDRGLRRGAGWIPGTARPGEAGNVGIAAHRDTFFRPLRELRQGDRVELQTPSGAQSYVVRSVYVVAPDFVEPLKATEGPTLTLVTCFPFDSIGPAPRRYIVRAVADSAPASLPGR